MNSKTTYMDGEQLNQQYPETFHIPLEHEKNALQVGDWVKVGLKGIPLPNTHGAERFWVTLTDISGVHLIGTVRNHLQCSHSHGVKFGDVLTFEMRHVIEVDPQNWKQKEISYLMGWLEDALVNLEELESQGMGKKTLAEVTKLLPDDARRFLEKLG